MKTKTPFKYTKRPTRFWADHNTDMRRYVMRERVLDRCLCNKGNVPPKGFIYVIPNVPGADGWRGQELLVDVYHTRMRKQGRCMRGNLK